MKKVKNFVLFSNCIPVKGIKRSIICDLQNNRYFLIPNGLYHILEKFNGKTIKYVKNEFSKKYSSIIDEYFEFLVAKNLIFFTSKPKLFPKIDLKWESASLISNIIIDYDKIEHNLTSILEELEFLKCSNIQFRFYKCSSYDNLSKIVQIINKKKSRITSIDFILPFDENLSKDVLDEFLKFNPRVHSIILFNSPSDQNFKPIREDMGYLSMVKKNLLNEKHCGNISSKYFYANMKLFSESHHYNTCLNKKISIDKEGNIRNCPSMSDCFGNINDTTLEEALNKQGFKKYWNISKDHIDVCKECEFRHICTDCRAYLEEPENIYSKPLKCGYDPYTNKWEKWSTNPLKENAIEFYGMQELVKRG